MTPVRGWRPFPAIHCISCWSCMESCRRLSEPHSLKLCFSVEMLKVFPLQIQCFNSIYVFGPTQMFMFSPLPSTLQSRKHFWLRWVTLLTQWRNHIENAKLEYEGLTWHCRDFNLAGSLPWVFKRANNFSFLLLLYELYPMSNDLFSCSFTCPLSFLVFHIFGGFRVK